MRPHLVLPRKKHLESIRNDPSLLSSTYGLNSQSFRFTANARAEQKRGLRVPAMALRPASSLLRCQRAPLVLVVRPLARERVSSASPPPPRCCAVRALCEAQSAAGRLPGLQAAPPPRQRRLPASATRHRRYGAIWARVVAGGGGRTIPPPGITHRRARGGRGRWSVARERGGALLLLGETAGGGWE